MIVHGHPVAPTTQMVLLCLAEKQLGAELALVDLSKGQQKSTENLARQPFGLTPSLSDEHGTLYECRAIIRYLDRTYPGPSLTPASPRSHGLMEQFINVEREYFSPKIMPFYYKKLLGMDPGAEQLEKSRTDAAFALDVLERALADRPFLAGDEFSLAEVAWTPYLALAEWTEQGQMIDERPAVERWWQQLRARPSWAKVNPWG
jgi:glutathione S-transferase